MSDIIVLHSKVSDESSAILADALKADRENPYVTKNNDFTKYNHVIKFGVSKKIKAKKGVVVNKSIPTKISTSKIKTFEALKDLNITVEYTSDINEASKWINQGYVVVARSIDNGSNSDGIVYVSSKQELCNTPAKFWTKLVDEAQEIRVYTWRNKVLSIYVKTIDKEIFNFKLIPENEVYTHPQLIDIVNKIYDNIGLDFCGIDIITDTSGKLNVLEVNSSPILFPYTLKRLVKNFKKDFIDEHTTV